MKESMKIKTTTILYKFKDPEGIIYEKARAGRPLEDLEKQFWEYLEGRKKVLGNVFLDEGVNYLWTLVCTGSGTFFDAQHACLGVGDGTTPEDPSQTGLRGANKYYKSMDSGFPTYGSGRVATFRATFGGNEANFAWNEWTVANGCSDDAINLNRKQEALGTKASGSTWILTVQLKIA